MGDAAEQPQVSFQTHPDNYRNVALEIEGPVATLKLDIKEDGGLRPGYELKLNSYDLGVDIELHDAVQRLRFEHPEVTCVVITSALEGAFSAGANIFMLGSSTHGFKVNFCKYTNETRLYIEDATEHSGQTYVAALNGIASGGGYELPLACEEIYLVDDRRSAVALPEVPYLGVLPGTGGLTRVVDKRKVRRDLADVFCTLAEGVRGKRAVEWGLVDRVWPTSKFQDSLAERVKEIAGAGRPERKGVKLAKNEPTRDDEGALNYEYVTLRPSPVAPRTMELELRVPTASAVSDPDALDCTWWPLQAWRELDNAILHLRFNFPEVGLVLLKTKGEAKDVLAFDAQLEAHKDHWFVNEVRHNLKRVLKRLDLSAKSLFALIEQGSCFAGSMFELALAADRAYMYDEDDVQIALSPMNAGPLPMSNGLTRLQTRFLDQPEHIQRVLAKQEPWGPSDALEDGLVTLTADEFDWEDDVRLAIEERASLSPDALTGMEASLRFAGPETLETKIFGRLSAWQNWIFQRPNAVGPKGALTLYGQPESAEYDYRRT
ncbi:MAG TPA: benzoyl-CoA-dihydrodiol lyase [Planctomycetes bacterium]|nr:benzoyl-CoA-dihydrodiol lyase [Planctomycetota bacterium]